MNIFLEKHNGCHILNLYIRLSYKPLRLWTEIMGNGFISMGDKKTFTDIYVNAHRTYTGFSKLATVWRIRKAKQTIDTDMYMNEIDKKHKNSIMIHQNNTNYWFTLSDLLNQIETALIHSPYYFAEPLEPKNPYTNIPFTTTSLYNIYFKILESTYLPSAILNGYFLAGFDLCKFKLENECLIREIHFRKYVTNTNHETIFDEIMSMALFYRLRIDPDVPKDKLIQIMRPYFYLYLVSNYHICGLEKQLRCRRILALRMTKLRRYNRYFGRKHIHVITNAFTNTHHLNTTYNMAHPDFTLNDAYHA